MFEAMEGSGTNDKVMTEILCTRNDEEIIRMKAAYALLYEGKSMDADIKGETSGELEATYVKLLQGGRTSGNDVDKDVESLYKAGEGKWGTDEEVFIDELAGNTRVYNEKIHHGYKSQHDKVNAKTLIK